MEIRVENPATGGLLRTVPVLAAAELDKLADLGYAVAALGFWAAHAAWYLAGERVPSWRNPALLGRKLIVRYAPVGLVGVIGPWKYPITNSFGDCIPALAAGNSVILWAP